MSDRLNIYFHYGSENSAYCALAVRGCGVGVSEPAMLAFLTTIIECVESHSRIADQSLSFLAADLVNTLTSQAKTSHLLPPSVAWPADLKINIWRLDEEEFWLSCEPMYWPDLDSLGTEDNPLNALDAFNGNIDQFKELVSLIDWPISDAASMPPAAAAP